MQCRHFLTQVVTEDKYEVVQSVKEAAIIIRSTKELKLVLTVHLTSPVVREESEKQTCGGRLSLSSPGSPAPPPGDRHTLQADIVYWAFNRVEICDCLTC